MACDSHNVPVIIHGTTQVVIKGAVIPLGNPELARTWFEEGNMSEDNEAEPHVNVSQKIF